MNKSILSAGLAVTLAVASPVSLAGHGQSHHYRDSAKVVKVEPIVRTVRIEEPRKECRKRNKRRHSGFGYEYEHSSLPKVIGGVAGGVMGNQFGQGRGNDAATIAGAILGTILGDGHDRGSLHRVDYQGGKRCTTVIDYRDEEVVDGYLVTYRYRGHKFVRKMDFHPGKRIKVRVSVDPVKRQRGSGGKHRRHPL